MALPRERRYSPNSDVFDVPSLISAMGIAGIPNSGLIILTLVLKSANLPNEAIQFAFPIVLSIDFIIARLRSAVNVMGDMQVAILLDVGEGVSHRDTESTETKS